MKAMKALDLLKEEHISTSTFLSACIVPLQIIWLQSKRWLNRSIRKQKRSAEEQFCIEKILDDEETLFKIDPSQNRWPVIQLYRNLLIVILSIFILNPLYRSMAFLVMFLCFVMHDWHRMPYKHPICVMNNSRRNKYLYYKYPFDVRNQ